MEVEAFIQSPLKNPVDCRASEGDSVLMDDLRDRAFECYPHLDRDH